MRYRLGLDLGTASCGLVALRIDEDGNYADPRNDWKLWKLLPRPGNRQRRIGAARLNLTLAQVPTWDYADSA